MLSICSFATSQAYLQNNGFVFSSPTALLLLLTRYVLQASPSFWFLVLQSGFVSALCIVLDF